MAVLSASAVFSRPCAGRRAPSRAARRAGAPLSAAMAPRRVMATASAVPPGVTPPIVGTQAPDFKATAVFDQEFIDVSLSQYRGKYVVLFFYPLDFTFVCPTEITAFSDRHAEFAALNCEVLGVSVDSEYSHLAWVQTERKAGGLGDIAYPLVSDLKKEISRAYQCLDEAEGTALRALYIIDKEGKIQHATTNCLAFGRNPDEVIRVLQAITHVQENPDEVCPAGWQPGDATMLPDPTGSKEYFSAL